MPVSGAWIVRTPAEKSRLSTPLKLSPAHQSDEQLTRKECVPWLAASSGVRPAVFEFPELAGISSPQQPLGLETELSGLIVTDDALFGFVGELLVIV